MKQLIVVCVAGLLLAGSGGVGAQGSAQAEKLLEGARRKAVVEGDLRSAIEQYARIVEQFKSQPDIAARALYQLAQCQEKLGQAEARKSYERILREYAAAAEFASAARTRLAAMQPSSARAGDLRTQLLWDNAVDLWGTTSADGRLLSFVDWDTGDLAVRDLVTNQSRRLTDKGGYTKAEGEAEGNAMSPDGKFVAFTWDRWDKDAEKEGSFQLRIVGADGKGERVVVRGGPGIWVEPQSWSADGKWIVTVVQERNTSTITLISPDGAQKRVVAAVPQRPMKSTSSPDGRWIAFHVESPGRLFTAQPEHVYVVKADGSSDKPVEIASNARFMGWAPDGSALLISKEWNEKRDLHVVPFADGRASGEPRVIAGAPEAHVLLGVTTTGTLIYGKTVRSTDAIVTSIDPATATVGKLVPEMPVASYGMGGTVGGMRFSPDGKYALFVRARDTFVVRTLADGSERRLAPQLADIGPVEWASDNRSLLIPGRSGGQQGIFRVDLGTGAAKLVFAQPGGWLLLANSPDGQTIYYRQPLNPSDPGVPRGAVIGRDVNTGAERTLLAPKEYPVLDLRLSRDGTKLLLMGRNHLRILDVASADVRILYDNSSDKRQPRFWGADWSTDGRYVLANVHLTAPGMNGHELWSLPVDGREPIRKVMKSAFRGLWLSPDGKHVGMMRWSNVMQVWSLDNFLPSRQRKS